MCQGFLVLPLLSEHEAVKRPQACSPTEALMQDLAGNAMALPVRRACLRPSPGKGREMMQLQVVFTRFSHAVVVESLTPGLS